VKGLLVFVSVVLVAAACGAADPPAAPPTNSTPPASSSSSAVPLASTSTVPPTTAAPRPDDGWRRENANFGRDVVLLSEGEGERVLLRYRADQPADVAFVIRDRWNDSHWTRRFAPGVDPNRDVRIQAEVQPLDDGLWFEVTSASPLDDGPYDAGTAADPPTYTGGVALHLRDGTLDIVTTGEREVVRQQGFTLERLLRSVLIPLPDQPVGVGARWQVGDNYLYSPPDAEFELIAIDGDLITLAVGGNSTAYDGDRYGGNYLDVEQSGTLRIDLSTGAATGSIRAVGVVEQSIAGERTPGTEEPFERETLIDIPARYHPLDERPHTLTLDHETGSGDTAVSGTVTYQGEVDAESSGAVVFAGSVAYEPGPQAGAPTEFELSLAPDGEPGTSWRGQLSLWQVFGSLVPRLPAESHLHAGFPDSLISEVVVPDLCIGGCSWPIEWHVVDISGSRLTLAADQDLELEISQRGASVVAEGTLVGEWTIDLFDPLAIEGTLAFDGSASLGAGGPQPHHESWTLRSTIG
jgi:hypothetical protein